MCRLPMEVGLNGVQLRAILCLCLLASHAAFADEPLSQRGAWEGNLDYFMTGAPLAINTNPAPGGGTDNNVDTLTDGLFEIRSQDVPTGATLVAAKLFWSGTQNQVTSGCTAVPDTQVTLTPPVGGASSVTADICYCSDSGANSYDVLACSADVTSVVGDDMIGDYVVSDYTGLISNGGTHSASTSLFLVFEEANLTSRRVVLYDGNVVLFGDSITMNLGGFTVDSTPAADLTTYVIEGEVDTAGDTIEVNGLPGTAPSIQVQDATNPANDIFNRTINTQGLTDVAGVDIDEFDISAGVQFLDTQVDVTVTASSDKVWVIANVIGVDQFFSQLSDLSTKTWTLSDDVDADGAAEPGDTVTYTLHLENTGNETATVNVTDPMSTGFASWQLQTPLASGTDASTASELIVNDVAVPAGGSVDIVVDAVIGSSTCSTTIANTFAWSAPPEGGVAGSKDAPTLNVLVDGDGDMVGDCVDNCPNDANADQLDTDNNGVGDVCDQPAEVCDGVDNDGDGTIDEGFDTDGDQLGDCLDDCPNDPDKVAVGVCGCSVSDVDTDVDGTADCIDACPSDPDKIAVGFCGCGVADTDTDGDGTPDCGDREVCDGVDNDGDGLVDDADPSVDPAGQTLAYEDADGDLHGNSLTATLFCTVPTGWVSDATDCDDANATRHPDLADVCDGIDNDCDLDVDEQTECSDDDGDGFTELGGDCDDANEDVSPAGREACNDVDDDCDASVDEGTDCVDDDQDGYCEGLDTDGDGVLDCSDGTLPGDCRDQDSSVSPNEAEIGFNGVDDDCDGQVDAEIADADGDGYTADAGDCAVSEPSVFPGGVELPDGLDNDCDGVTDEGTALDDIDGDGWCEGADVDGDGTEDCLDGDTPGDCWEGGATVHPGASEDGSNGVDDDCDGVVDEGTLVTDDDGDGLSEAQGDCDDEDPAVYPGAEESLNGADDNCNDLIDEGLSDLDGDGWTSADGDCDDDDGWVNPGLEELCDGQDNDCDLLVDEATCDDAEIAVTPSNCGCRAGGPAGWLPLVLALALVRRRRTAIGLRR